MLRTLVTLCLLALAVCSGCLTRHQATNSPDLTVARQEAEPVPKWVGPSTWWDAHPVLSFTGLAIGVIAVCAVLMACTGW
jgi:hypothetical protein